MEETLTKKKPGRPSTAGLRAELERERAWRRRVQERVAGIEKLRRIPTIGDVSRALNELLVALTED